MPVWVNADLQLLEKATSIFITNCMPVPTALYKTTDFLLNSNQQQKRAEHRHIYLISSQNHCYHGKKLLFFPLSTDIWIPSPERARQFTFMYGPDDCLLLCFKGQRNELGMVPLSESSVLPVFLGRKRKKGSHRNLIKAFKLARG